MTDKSTKPVSADAFEDDFYVDEPVASDHEEAQEDDHEKVGAKRKAKDKKKKKKKQKVTTEEGVQEIDRLYKESPSVQFAYVRQHQKKALPKLSDVELEEQTLPESQFVDNSKFTMPDHTLDALPNYVKFGVMQYKQLLKKPEELASPRVLVLTHSAIRAADLVRALKGEFDKAAKVAKLFAKHFKIEQQIQYLKEKPLHIGVGTPNRIRVLTEEGHLKMDKLELVIVDTEKNAKTFNIFENDAVRGDLYMFLGQFISPRMKENKTKLGLF